MTLSFNRQEMIDALEANGYVIKNEEYVYEFEEHRYYYTDVKTRIDFVYKHGDRVKCDEYIVRSNRIVEEVFSKLLNKKILELLYP